VNSLRLGPVGIAEDDNEADRYLPEVQLAIRWDLDGWIVIGYFDARPAPSRVAGPYGCEESALAFLQGAEWRWPA
jgi:hypothetical protein